MILMRAKMVRLSITLVTLMTVTSQKRIYLRRLSDVVLLPIEGHLIQTNLFSVPSKERIMNYW